MMNFTISDREVYTFHTYSVLGKRYLLLPIYVGVGDVFVNRCEILFSVLYLCVFQEDFLDLTVAVKNVSGLEDALWTMYIEEEVFDCDNLYHCGTCDRLVKATKVRQIPAFSHGPTQYLVA